jgi:alpha-L-fucosidase
MKILLLLTCLLILGLVPARPADAPPALIPAARITAGPFQPTDESFAQYKYPDWFRDAKFGIWAHWGPQAVPRQGDWYAKKMYMNQTVDKKTGEKKGPDRDYTYHVAHYGHPSQFGYKDIIPLWKAEKWDPEKLMALYKKAGAKYFVSMGSHHDNFFLWNSKIHRWNAVNLGPKKDVVGLWQKAAQKEGLRFGVSEHLAASFNWFQSSHGADTEGPLAGVPYDGNDPANQDLYHPKGDPTDTGWLTKNTDWHREWFNDVKELVETYHPDLLYSDSALPFGDVGRSMLANYYNQDIAHHGGKLEAVYNCKEESKGKWAHDFERGVAGGISEFPWQTDTSIGDWYYRTGQKYMTSGEVVRMLTDIVSKNGNLLLNVVQTPEGDLEPDILTILDEIATWIAINGEAIYGTRPWKLYGEGPSTDTTQQEKGHFAGLKDVPKKPYSAADFRFTTKSGALYAVCLAAPTEDLRIISLGQNSKLAEKAIASVELLGSTEKVAWKQEAAALVITKPARIPNPSAVAYKITFKN